MFFSWPTSCSLHWVPFITFTVAKPPFPHRSQRLQQNRARIHEELDQLCMLPPVDHNPYLHHSRRDSPLPFTHIDLGRPFFRWWMNPETPQSYVPITSNEEISTSLLIVGQSLPSSFNYVLIRPVNTNSIVSGSLSATMSNSTPPPFTYPITSTSGPSIPSNSIIFVGPQSSSLSGSGTTFNFGMGSSSVIGSKVPSTKMTTTTTSTFIPWTFSLWSTPIVHNVSSAS